MAANSPLVISGPTEPQGLAGKPRTFHQKTQVRITRPGCASILLRVPDDVDWFELVQRCAREFGNNK
jgi:hypothetical protein